MTNITVADLRTVDGEPRVLDITLAERLGIARPRNIRGDLISPNIDELRGFGGLLETPANPGVKGGRPGRVYWLNEPQALLVCMFARTAAAAAIRRQLIEAFMAYRAGKVVPVKDHARRPPRRRVQPYSFEMRQRGPNEPVSVAAVVPMKVALEMAVLMGSSLSPSPV